MWRDLVLLHLVLDVLQVGTQRLRAHPLDACLRGVQPVGELLQLLVLQVHEDLVEPGRETEKERVRERERDDERASTSVGFPVMRHYAPLWVTDETLHASNDVDEAKDWFLIDFWQNDERKLC